MKLLYLFLALLYSLHFFGQDTYSDTFSSVSYSNNNGNSNFSSNWTESNDDSSASGGRIRITGNELRFNQIFNESITRTANLSASTSAVLSFNWRTSSLETGETLAIQASVDGITFFTLATMGGTSSGSFSQDVSTFLAFNTTIRFIKGGGNWSDNSDFAFIDNFLITAITLLDSDNDGIVDDDDLDDDNDGILDIDEGGPCVTGTVSSLTLAWQSMNYNTIVGQAIPLGPTTMSTSEQITFVSGPSAGLLSSGAFFGPKSYITLNGYYYFNNQGGYSTNGADYTYLPPGTPSWNGGNLSPALAMSNLNLSGTGSETVPFLRWVGFIDVGNDGTYNSGVDQYLGATDYNGFAIVPTVEGTLHMAFTDDGSFNNQGSLLLEFCLDTDNDGIPNHLDLDSDNDGCNDVIEAGFTDNDNNGLLGNGTSWFNGLTVNSNGEVTSGTDGYTTPADGDSNGTQDFVEPGSMPTINTQPSDQTVFIEDNGSFTIAATGSNATYQWQRSTDGGANFNDLSDGLEYSGTNTANLTVQAVPLTKNGHRYRVVMASTSYLCGFSISTPALLNVRVKTVITNRRITHRVKKN